MAVLLGQDDVTVEVPDEDVEARIVAGENFFEAGEKIPVIRKKDNRRGFMPAELARENFANGKYEYESDIQRRAAKELERRRSLTGAAGAFGLGLLRGAFFTDEFLRPILGDELDHLKKANEGWAATGEVSGAVLAGILTGGESAVAKVAAKTPMGLLTKAGGIVKSRIAGRLGSEAVGAGVLRQVAPEVARGAFEAGVGMGALEATRPENLELLARGDNLGYAENIGAGIKVGTLFGAGTSGVLGLTGVAASRGLSRVARLARGAKQTATHPRTFEAVADSIKKEVEADPLNNWAKLIRGLHGQEAADLATGGARVRDLAMRSDSQKLSGEFVDALHKGVNRFRDFSKLSATNMRDVQLVSGLQGMGADAVAPDAVRMLASLRAVVAEMEGTPGHYFGNAKIKQMALAIDDAEGKLFVDVPVIGANGKQVMMRVRDGVELAPDGTPRLEWDPNGVDETGVPGTWGEVPKYREVGATTQAINPKLSAADVHKEFNDLKTNLDTPAEWSKGHTIGGDSTGKNAANRIRQAQKTLAGFLEDAGRGGVGEPPLVWGVAGKAYGKFNNALSELIRWEKYLLHPRHFGAKDEKNILEVAKGFSFLTNISAPTTERSRKALSHWMKAAKNFADLSADPGLVAAINSTAQTAEKQVEVARLLAKWRKLAGDTEVASSAYGNILSLRSVVKKAGSFGSMSGAAMIAQHPLGAAVGLAANLATDPEQLIRVLHVVDKAAMQVDRHIGAVAKAIATGKRVERAVMAGAVRVLDQTQFSEQKYSTPPKSAKQAAWRRSGEIAAVMANPVDAARRIEAKLISLKSDPETAPLVPDLVAKALAVPQYLAPLTPNEAKGSIFDKPLPDGDGYSDFDVGQFALSVNAAVNPLSVLEDVMAGTLTPEGVDALNALNPQLKQKFLTSILAAYDEEGTTPDYAMRMQLSMLSGQPIDSSLTPTGTGALQATYAQNQEQPPGPTPKKTEKLKFIDQTKSETDRLLT